MIAWRNSESQLCAHNFIWDGQEKAALSTLEMGSLFLWGRTDGPPGCQRIFYSWLLFFPPSLHQTVKNVHPSLISNVFHPTLSSPRSQGPFGGQWLEPTAKKSPKHVSNLHCCISKCTLHPWIEFTFNLGILEARPVVSNLTTRKWRRYRRKSIPLQWGALRWITSSLWWNTQECQQQ